MKERFKYLATLDDRLVKYDTISPLDSLVIDPDSNRLITNSKSRTAIISSALFCGETISEEIFNLAYSKISNKPEH